MTRGLFPCAFVLSLCIAPAAGFAQAPTEDVLCLKKKSRTVRGTIVADSTNGKIVVLRTKHGVTVRHEAYNRDWAKAVGFAATWGTGWGLYFANDRMCYEQRRNCGARSIGQFLVLTSWIGSWIEGPRRATDLNDRRAAAAGLRPYAPEPPKEPTRAWLLSFALPGVGQIYNDDWEKAAAFAAAWGVGLGLRLGNHDRCKVRHEGCSMKTTGEVLFYSAWIASQIEAPLRSFAINRRHGLSLDIGPTPHPLGLSLASLQF